MAWYYIQEILEEFATNFLKVAKLVYQDIESVLAMINLFNSSNEYLEC